MSYCWRRFSKLDEFTRITIYFTAACVALTVALIIDSAVGVGSVPMKFSVKTSDPFCDTIVENFIKSSRNSHNAAVLGNHRLRKTGLFQSLFFTKHFYHIHSGSLCLLGMTPDQISAYGGGVAVVSKLGVDGPPEYLDFYGLHPSPEVNPAPDNAENKIFQPYPALMQGFKILLKSRKNWEGEMASWTYSGKKIKNFSLDELFDYLIANVPEKDIETFTLIKENYDEGNVEPDANDDPNFVEYVAKLKSDGLQKMEQLGETKDVKIENATEGEKADYELGATIYFVKDRTELLQRYSSPLLNDWLEGSSKEGARIKEADLTKHDNSLRSAFVSVIGDDFVSVGLSFTLGSPEKIEDVYSKCK